MPLYVSLGNWTDQGVRTVKETIKRADALVAAAQKLNCKVREIVWTMGAYDVVTIVEAPNDQVASQLALGTGMGGNVRTLTMRGYEKAEMEKIIAGL